MSASRPLAVLSTAPDHRWQVPGSKSITNRALLLAALAEGDTVLRGTLASDDTRTMCIGLTALGVAIEDRRDDAMTVHGTGSLVVPAGEIQVGNSGTTVRFLTAIATIVEGPVRFVGNAAMARRPIGDLVGALAQLGIDVDCPTGCPPLTVHGGAPLGTTVRIRGDRSSQYLSALLMLGPLLPEGLAIGLTTPLVSRPYAEITRAVMGAFGATTMLADDGFQVTAGAYHSPGTYVIEPDVSAASYAFATAAATGGRIVVPGLTADALQGDIAFLQVLEAMGCTVGVGQDGIAVTGPSSLQGIEADLHHLSDTVPTLAALAPLCDGPLTIRNVANIRLKETDRITALVTELRRLGQEVEEFTDGLRIDPRPVTPATVQCYDDHRMAMAFAVLGLAREGVSIENPACVAKTYPGFWNDLAAVYAGTGTAVPWMV